MKADISIPITPATANNLHAVFGKPRSPLPYSFTYSNGDVLGGVLGVLGGVGGALGVLGGVDRRIGSA